MNPYVAVLIAYLSGSLPFAYLAGRFFGGVDLRRQGSGNLGATNVFRVLGLPAAFVVFLLDAAKGALPVLLLPAHGPNSEWWSIAYGVAAILGHVRPVFFLWRRGGKGVATASKAQSIDMSEKIDLISALRARFGYARERWSIYATGGLALAETHVTDIALALSAEQGRVLRWQPGWVLGAGTEFTISSDWKARVEYEYTRLNPTAVTFPGGTGIRSSAELNGLRAGLTRSVGFHRARREGAARSPPAPELAQWTIHGQATGIEQGYFRFRSPYEGANSLTGASQTKNTVSATVPIVTKSVKR